MKYLVYELFSGVGFCNQLFSLETAIYLANISKRKLILLIRNPLVHCGRSSWGYGKLMDFFSNDYLQFLEHGIEVHYGLNVPPHINRIINEKNTLRNVFKGRLSHLGIIDKNIYEELGSNINTSKIRMFLHNRKPFILDIDSWEHEYIYITESNASRCFYNFLTSKENYNLMSQIGLSLTKFNMKLTALMNTLQLPDTFMAFHLRLGDVRHSKNTVDRDSSRKFSKIDALLNTHSSGMPILLMSDRKDGAIIEMLKSKHKQIQFTEDFIDHLKETDLRREFPEINDFRVLEFLLQKFICERNTVFVGYHFSTVSHHIQYMNFINGKNSQLYIDGITKFNQNNYDWVTENVYGASIAFKTFFSSNVIINQQMTETKLITLTNDGYMDLTENLLLSMQNIGIEQLLKVYCIGEKSYNHLRKEFPLNEIIQVDSNNDNLKGWVHYKSQQNPDVEGKKLWATITSYKMYVINKELCEGNDVIFTDGDIVFEKNPIPYMMQHIEEGMELLIQNDEQSELTPNMCTGFFWMKSNDNTKQITNFETITKNIQYFTNDQQYLRRFGRQLKHKYLDLNLFPNGKYFRQKSPASPFIIHFNYDVSDMKITRMKRYKKWYIDDVKREREKKNVDSKELLTEFIHQKGIQLKQGYVTQSKDQTEYLLKSIKDVQPNTEFKKVLEIGFLAGHSAELFLKMNNSIHVTSVDTCAFQSVAVGKLYIDTHYPNRHNLIKGDSKDVVSKMDVADKFDIIFIDGSYDAKDVEVDLINCMRLCNKDTIIIMNNVIKNKVLNKYWTTGPSTVWTNAVNKQIQELYSYDISVGRGFAVGKLRGDN